MAESTSTDAVVVKVADGSVDPTDSTSHANVGTVANADAATPSSASSPSPSPSPTKFSTPAPPRWRFVESAKKKAGYSTLDAGFQVDGLSAEELAAKYHPPTMTNSSDGNGNGNGDRVVGRLAIPSFLQSDGNENMESHSVEPWKKKQQEQESNNEVTEKKEEEVLEKEDDGNQMDMEITTSLEPWEEKGPTEERTANSTNERTNDQMIELKDEEKADEENDEGDVFLGHLVVVGNEKDNDEEAAVVKEEEKESSLAEEDNSPNANADADAAVSRKEDDINNDIDDGNKSGDTKKRRYLYWGIFAFVLVIGASVGAAVAILMNNNGGDDGSVNSQALRGSGGDSSNDVNDIDIGDGIGDSTTITANVPSTSPTIIPSPPPSITTMDVLPITASPNNPTSAPIGTTTTTPNPTVFDLETPPPRPPPSFTFSSPTSSPFDHFTSSPTTMPSSPATTTMPSYAATESLLSCRFNFVKFVLDISSYVGINPGDISWILAEKCTLNVIERCQGCYGGNNTSTTTSSTEIDSNSGFFQTCLPATNATTGDPAGYVFVMMDSGGNGLCDNGICGGYSIVYDGEAFRFGGNFTETQEATFGGGGAGCDEGEGNDNIVVAPLPTNSPTSRTTTSLTNSPTARATTISSSPSQFPSQSSSGSSQFPSQSPQQCVFPEQTQEQCAQDVTIEYRLTEPRSLGGDFTNRQFGSTVTFVGSNGNIVAAGGGDAVRDSRVHIYHKPSGSDWIYLTSLDPGLDELSTAFNTLSLASSQEGYIVIGVPLSIEDELNSSKVYVYAPNESMTEWTQIAILLPDIISSVSNFPAFGSKVAIENNTIIVSSVGENYGRGAVYVFERLDGSDVWDQVAKFSPEDLTDGASFGASISLQDGTLVVGGDFVGVGGTVYVFQKGEESWQLEASLIPVDVFSGEEFGASVAVSGCTMAVSSPKDESGSGSGTGTVRIFEYYPPSNSWFQVQALEAEDALTGDVFGDCVAIEGNTLLVGSLSGGNSTGVVHQFEKNGSGQFIFDVRWTKTREISNPDPDSGDSFGCDISLSGNMAIVGAKMDSSLAQFSGSAYLFDLCPSAIFT